MIEIDGSSILYVLKIILKVGIIVVLILGMLTCIAVIMDNIDDIKERGKDYIKNTRLEEVCVIAWCTVLMCILAVLILVIAGVIVINNE